MAEQFKSITDARKELPTLATTVESGSDRVVITNQGKPQAVLLGYDDFQGLQAAVELLNRPEDLARLRRGLAENRRIGFDELLTSVEVGNAKQDKRDARRLRESAQVQTALKRIEESVRTVIAEAVRSTRIERAAHGSQRHGLSVSSSQTGRRSKLAVNR